MEKNIFEAMGSQSGSGKPGKRQQPERRQLAVPSISRDPEKESMLQRMKEMKSTLEQQLDEVYSKGKEVKLPVNVLVEDITQLPPAQQDEVRQRENALKEKLKGIGPSTHVKRKASGGEPPPSGPQTPPTDRKAKLRGARNKWIPVK